MNSYETEARQRKAIALTNAALSARDGQGFTVAEVEQFTDDQWELLAEIAGVRHPSEVTKALVLQSMRVRLQITRQVDAGRDAERAAEVDALFSGLGR